MLAASIFYIFNINLYIEVIVLFVSQLTINDSYGVENVEQKLAVIPKRLLIQTTLYSFNDIFFSIITNFNLMH